MQYISVNPENGTVFTLDGTWKPIGESGPVQLFNDGDSGRNIVQILRSGLPAEQITLQEVTGRISN